MITFRFDDGTRITLPWTAGMALLLSCRRQGWEAVEAKGVN